MAVGVAAMPVAVVKVPVNAARVNAASPTRRVITLRAAHQAVPHRVAAAMAAGTVVVVVVAATSQRVRAKVSPIQCAPVWT